ncbi:metallophosphoesterase [Sorangium sp. So ce1014]|uniref:metallophosphoesterase n=1 Tax=Sorangium sp. So ce1014 TaxID=3133326 RepID=UPI003F5DED77
MLHSSRDEALAQDIERLFAVLERQGMVETWSPRRIPAGQEVMSATQQQIQRADIILLLTSADFLAADDAAAWIQLAQQRRMLEGTRVIPVLLRPAVLPKELDVLAPLPRNRRAISTWADRDEALLEVVDGVRTALAYRPALAPAEPRAPAAPSPPPGGIAVEVPQRGVTVASATPIQSIFRLNGPPDITFVEPSQFPALQVELDTLGSGLIVEGPSRVGKSTAVRKVLALQRPARPQRWLDGKLPPSDFEAVLDGVVRGQDSGHLIVDDVHHLDDALKRQLAVRMKILADQEQPRAKVTVIGINPIGSSLTEALPDLSGRFRIIRMDRQRDVKIAELIIKGEQAANIRFTRRDELITEAGGSFFIAQLLCYQAAVSAGIRAAQERLREVTLGPADVMESIQEELRARYHGDLRDFAAYDEAPPPRGGCLALLWMLSQTDDGDVSIGEAIHRYPDLAPALQWLRSSNLQRCFQEQPRLSQLLYYNRAAGTLSLEDPQLKFYLRKLDWRALARASGHRSVQFHPIDGPLFTPPSSRRGGAPQGGTPPRPASALAATPAGTCFRVLHLSDLHFNAQDQATLWYAQLAADLRQQGCQRLDGLVISGDVGNLSIPEEYTAARLFLDHVMGGFGLSPQSLVLVPGNHDLNWSLSQDAYRLERRARYRGEVKEGTFIAHGADVIEVRDEDAYKLRFRHFAEFYRQVKGEEYPLDYERQATIHHLPECGLLFLGLNSAWEIDHHHRARAGVHTGAVARALIQLERYSRDALRIAVWHHPVTSAEPDQLNDAGFLQQLAVAGFRVALHGHVHRAENQIYRYDMSPGGRRLEIVSAGTFGAPARQWVPGYPLQYNLLLFSGGMMTVETRCREEMNGAWRPDARWLQGTGRDPLPRYQIPLE